MSGLLLFQVTRLRDRLWPLLTRKPDLIRWVLLATLALGVAVSVAGALHYRRVAVEATQYQSAQPPPIQLRVSYRDDPQKLPGLLRYERALEANYRAADAFLSRYFQSNNSADYYYLQFAFDGALSMYEAGGDLHWLDLVVTRGFAITERAQRRLDGELGWKWMNPRTGRDTTVTEDSILCELQFSRPLLRAARLAGRLTAYRHSREAKALSSFVLDHVLAKWFDRRAGAAGVQRPDILARDPWFVRVEAQRGWEALISKAANLRHPWLDTWSMAAMLYIDAYMVTGVEEYRERAALLARLFKQRQKIASDGAWIWDEASHVGAWSESSHNSAGAPDTSHANREAAWVVHAFLAGIGFDRADVAALGATFRQRLYLGKTSQGFANYITGQNTPYRRLGPGEGMVFDGWARLAWVLPDVYVALDGLWHQRVTTDEQTMNGTIWADLSLPGHLALAEALHNAAR